MKTFYSYIAFLFILLLTACTDETYTSAPASPQGKGYQFTVSIPEPMVATRSIGSALTSDYVTSLPMHILVFDEKGFFVAFQKAIPTSYNEGTRQGTYTVDLPNSDQKRILHFVLGNVDFSTYTPADTETNIFSTLSVGNNTDVYWQREEVDYIVKQEDENTGATTILAPPLTDVNHVVRLIRNFAQISVDVRGEAASHLTLDGFVVLRHIDRGTVAPFSGSETNGGFASFDIADGENDYESFTQLNPTFSGCNPPREGSNLIDEVNENDFTTSSKYVYERNQDEAESPAYVLVKAQYDETPCFYKLDIVSFDPETFVTSYLNLYRNFHYQIHINKVAGKGYDTIEEAIENVASNNISASIEVSQVNKIEDGLGNELSVDELDIMIVSTEDYTLNYNYVHGGHTHNESPTYVQVTPIGGSDGGGYNHKAIQEIRCNGDGTITITPVNPLPDIMETQEFIVAGASGLSRRVTVRVREKFVFAAVDCDNVESSIGAEMTLAVRLPDNMPTAAFPLTLDIEPEKKSIYPDVSKNRIPVTSQEQFTFSYQAIVTYNDYRQNHTFFFHFKSNMADSATEIVVTNDYFRDDSENDAIPFDEKTNVTSFENRTKTYNFLNVRLSGEGFDSDNNEFTDYQTKGKEITLTFGLHTQGDDYTPAEGDEHIVEIFSDYFDLETAKSTTGEIKMREDGQCILYTPDEIYGTHSITFTVKENLASETIQLSALDHNTATLSYSTQPLVVDLDYIYDGITENVPNETTISIYLDADGDGNADNDELVTTKDTNYQGQITMDSFANIEESDTLIFRCTLRIQTGTDWWGGATYDNITFTVSTTVQGLLENPSLTMTQGY